MNDIKYIYIYKNKIDEKVYISQIIENFYWHL